MNDDPDQTVNLWGDPACAAQRDALVALLAESVPPMQTPRPERRARREQRRTGIEVAPATLQTLLDTAEKLAIDAVALSNEP